jgi:hypothetical protein
MPGETMTNGKIAKSASGGRHIFEEIKPSGITRAQELVNGQIVNSVNDVNNLIVDIIKTGTVSPASPSGSIFSKLINNKVIQVVVGDNGYVVTVKFAN